MHHRGKTPGWDIFWEAVFYNVGTNADPKELLSSLLV
jgi:hypothetical protein